MGGEYDPIRIAGVLKRKIENNDVVAMISPPRDIGKTLYARSVVCA